MLPAGCASSMFTGTVTVPLAPTWRLLGRLSVGSTLLAIGVTLAPTGIGGMARFWRREADARLVGLQGRVRGDEAGAIRVRHDRRIHQRIGREAAVRRHQHAGDQHGVAAAVGPVAVGVAHIRHQVHRARSHHRVAPLPLIWMPLSVSTSLAL